jgi:hypothetical protein
MLPIRQIETVRIIRWLDNSWAISILYVGNHLRQYVVGDFADALAEAERILQTPLQ